MLLSIAHFTALLALSTEVLGGFNNRAINAFKHHEKVKPSLEQRHPAVPKESWLDKRQYSRFLNNATEKFVVNGSAIPDVDFDIGESYAGLLPISSNPDETRKLFFWFVPSTNPAATDEVVIWFNGGPGCSSLSGLLTENGPFLWQAGTLAPTPNSYSWSNLTNMLWVEQPIGVGYSQGTPNITNEVELGLEFIGFYKEFIDAFQLHGAETYITGESYAGYYVPYVADAFITANNLTYYNLAGVGINDPILGDGTIQQQVVLFPYVEYWSELFYLNETFMGQIRDRQVECNYSSYLEQYYTFPPPPGPFPVLPDPYQQKNYTCDLFDTIYEAAVLVNPCFNIYHITDTCPFLISQLGIVNTGDYSPPGAQVYFNRTDVKHAINAPLDSNWQQCTDINVFGNGNNDNYTLADTSLAPAQNDVLRRVIEYTNNTFIGVGNLDFLLAPNGTLFALQNATWNGLQGFQEYPQQHEFYVPYHPEYNGGRLSESGIVGKWGYERGLTFYTVQLAGHQLPGYSAGSGFRMLEALLGRVANLSDTSNFPGQNGNYTGNGIIYK